MIDTTGRGEESKGGRNAIRNELKFKNEEEKKKEYFEDTISPEM